MRRPATTKFRNVALASTAVEVKAAPGLLYAYNIANLDGGNIYVKFYDKAAADVNPASDVPVYTVHVPTANAKELRTTDLPVRFLTAISVRCVTGGADTNTTAATTKPVVELEVA